MELEQNVDVLDSLETPREIKRNAFITVLCILTWVGCGVMLIYYLFVLGSIRVASDFADNFGNGLPSELVNTARWHVIYYIAASICVIPCIIGAVLMWRMKVAGFVIYVIGEGAPVLLGFFVAFNGSQLGAFSIVSSVASAVVPVGFVVMYGINLKYMRVLKDDEFY